MSRSEITGSYDGLIFHCCNPWMKLEDIVSSEISESKKGKQGMISHICSILNYHIHRIKEWNGDYQGMRNREMRKINKHKVLIKQDE